MLLRGVQMRKRRLGFGPGASPNPKLLWGALSKVVSLCPLHPAPPAINPLSFALGSISPQPYPLLANTAHHIPLHSMI